MPISEWLIFFRRAEMESSFILNPLVALAGIGAYYTIPTEIQETFYGLRWMVLFIIFMIIADFYLGLTESVKVKKESFRYSRAGRRTVCKFIEYMIYIMTGALLGKSFLEPMGIGTYEEGGALGSVFAAVFELDSIKGHVCAIHGVKFNFSFKRFIVAMLKKKDKDAGEAFEEATKEEK